jgi:hypothetical protein
MAQDQKQQEIKITRGLTPIVLCWKITRKCKKKLCLACKKYCKLPPPASNIEKGTTDVTEHTFIYPISATLNEKNQSLDNQISGH